MSTTLLTAYGVNAHGYMRLELETRQIVCAHCGVGTIQRKRSVRRVSPEFEESPSAKAGIFEKMWSCDFCNGVTVELIECDGSSGNGGGGRKITSIIQLWPTRTERELEADVPEPIRDRFREGSACEGAGAYRGAAAMYRAAVEELCKERGATKKTLYDKIEELRGQLDVDLVRDLHEARMLGNDSVHDGLAYSPEEVADVAQLIVEMTQILYVEPAKRAAMRAARQQRREAHKNGS
jgi:hypothetical protein